MNARAWLASHGLTAPEPAMDDFDLAILDALQTDGRLTNDALAERVGLSPSQCSRRRAALEADGVIERYAALLSARALGLGVTVFVEVRLATHSPDNSQRFKALIDGLGYVQEAYALTGASDYLVKMVVPDLPALSRVLNDVFLPHGSVAHVRSAIVLDRLKCTPRLPLDHLGRTPGGARSRPVPVTGSRPRRRPAGD